MSEARSRRLLLVPPAILIALNMQGVMAAAETGKENQSALKDAAKQLKTKIPASDGKKAPRYLIELKATQSVRATGKEPVQKVEEPHDLIQGEDIDETVDAMATTIERPPLDSLIKVQGNINPFSLDARYIEKIGLPDTLEAALAQNLDIDEAYSRMKSQRYAYLSAASGFLPNLNAGYNLFGIHGSIPGALFGASSGSGSSSVKLPSSIQLLSAGFVYNAYQGGKILFGTLEQKHRLRATNAALKTSVNDTLLSAARGHYELVLNEALLAIRVRAVSISQEQVRLNTSQEKAGAATGLDVLQSQAQLASDEQNLVDQQNTRRQSAIRLAHLLNVSFTIDLESSEKYLRKRRLVSKRIPIEELLKIAIDKRPELKQYEELRLAAKRSIVVAGAPLQPAVSLGGTVLGIGSNGSNLDPIYTLNFGVKWSLGRLGATDIANIQKARWDTRQAEIKAKQTFLNVFEDVRSAYDKSLASDKRIDRASVQIVAAEEELRIAKKRMEAGIGLNIDVLNAQRDLTQASINKAHAIVDFNIAQAELLRAIGTISVDGLVHGLKLQ